MPFRSVAASEPSVAKADDDAWAAFADSSYSGLVAGAASPPKSPPYAAQWTATAGAWDDANDWLVTDPGEAAHSVPGANDVATLNNNGSPGYTVTYNTTDAIWSIRSGSAVTLDLQSGLLNAKHGGAIAGTLDLAAAATLAVAADTLFVANGVYSGALSGAGAIDFTGDATIDANAITVAALILGADSDGVASSTTLDANVGYSGDFQLDYGAGAAATLDLNGDLFNLKGTGRLNGAITGGGTFDVAGAATLLGHFQVKGGAKFVALAGATITQAGRVLVGDSGASAGSLTIDSGAAYDVVATVSLGDADDAADADVDNSGAMTVAGDSLLTLNGDFANSGGATLSVDAGGIVYLAGGTAALNGTIAGAGELKIDTGENATLDPSRLDIAEVSINGGAGGGVTTLETDITYSGRFVFNSVFGQLDLNGETLTLAGASNAFVAATIRYTTGAVSGGTLDVTGAVTQFSGTFIDDTINDDGTIDQTENVNLPGSTLHIAAGATYQFVTQETAIFSFDDIDNAGTLADATPGGDAYIFDASFTSTGTLSVALGDSLGIVGYGSGTLSGTITGGGGLSIGFGEFAIDTSDITVGSLRLAPFIEGPIVLNESLNYRGEFSLDAYLSVGEFELATGVTLTLSGENNQLNDGYIIGGTIKVTGAATLSGDYYVLAIGADTSLVDAGALEQVGDLILLGSLSISSGHSYTITEASDLEGEGSTVVNAGDFVDNSGTGVSTVKCGFTNNGRVVAESGSLIFRTEILGAGTDEIDAGAYLQLNWQSTASQKLEFAGAGAELGLAAPSQFSSDIYDFGASAGEAIDLIGFNANATKSFASASDGLIVNVSDGGVNHVSLHFVGSYNQAGFQLKAGSNGELLSYSS